VTDKPADRKTHVYRYIGKTLDGSGQVIDAEGSYLDLERIDRYVTKEGSGQDYQKTTLRLKWYEDEEGKIPNGRRHTRTLKIIPPGEDPDNPSLWFEVPALKSITIIDNDQRIVRRFNNTDTNTRRKVKVRRVTHFDTPFDDDPAYAQGGVIRNYEKMENTEDEDQYLDVEIPLNFTTIDYDQRTRAALNNQYLIEATREPDQNYGDAINPPWRLDPLQNIVNVRLDNKTEKIAVFTGNPATVSAMWFKVADKLPVRFASKIVFWGTGQQQPFTPSPFTTQKVTGRGASVGDMDDKSNSRLVAGVLYNLDGSQQPTPADASFDKDAKPITEFPDVPPKGKSIAGLGVTNSSLTKYGWSNAVIWTREIDVEELFVNRDGPGTVTVLGEGDDSSTFLTVSVIDTTTGVIVATRHLTFGLDPVFDTFGRKSWDTSSNGDLYVAFGSGIKALDIDGRLKWTYLFDPVASFNDSSSNHAIAVIEDKKGNAFCLVADFNRRYGTNAGSDTIADSDGAGDFQDHFIRIFSATGSQVGQIAWGTTEFAYHIDEVNISGLGRFVRGIDRSIADLAGSTSRFPDPA
jgi:hypothetical protein